jgi:hypothetical protein
MSETDKLNLSMPFAKCWKKLFDLEIQKVLDAVNIQAPVPQLSITNQDIGANTFFIATDLTKQTPLKPKKPACIFRIYVCLDTAGIFSVQRYAPDKTISVENMNQGVALTASAGYMFDILVDQGEGIDFKTTVAAKILKMSVVEKDDAK